ncbi:hypothetical protein LTR85_003558 [Meristemomyces frigidus]|nr:hypothetical protein LTR85_003558 [Meristemomyces frigidus]
MPPCLAPFRAADHVLQSLHDPPAEWSEEQQLAIVEFFRITHEYRERAKVESTPVYIRGCDKQKLIRVFGRIFFCATLQDVEYRPRTTLLSKFGNYGQTWNSEETGNVLIEIDTSIPLHSTSNLPCVLSLLLHECTHAYFFSECCYSLCGSERCAEIYHASCGALTHGPAWQILAHTVERKADFVLGMHFDLRRGDAAAQQTREEEDLGDPLLDCLFGDAAKHRIRG